MCPNTCLVYTGPYELLESCPKCTMSHWNQEKLQTSNGCTKVPACKFTTITLVTQLQARENGKIPVTDDIAMGWNFLGTMIVVMLSLDGAQLYQSKELDFWIYIWKINVIPGRFIPGPKKPQNINSFLFPGLHHVFALQKEGLQILECQP
ncbi:hypothetical protein BS17DRAFT_795519 [Gyrodon lividus]|nr:hypothetical protein BS17DRAFT_795519 [Gyrodon lividus]